MLVWSCIMFGNYTYIRNCLRTMKTQNFDGFMAWTDTGLCGHLPQNIPSKFGCAFSTVPWGCLSLIRQSRGSIVFPNTHHTVDKDQSMSRDIFASVRLPYSHVRVLCARNKHGNNNNNNNNNNKHNTCHYMSIHVKITNVQNSKSWNTVWILPTQLTLDTGCKLN